MSDAAAKPTVLIKDYGNKLLNGQALMTETPSTLGRARMRSSNSDRNDPRCAEDW